MRLDRFITLSMVQPARHAVQALGSRPSALGDALPILMYHSISDEAESDRAAYFRTNTAPAVFAQHLELLKALGYNAVTLTEALSRIRSDALPQVPDRHASNSADSSKEKLVVLTFDDGFRDFYTEAFPLLAKHGFAATMYLPTAYVRDACASFKGKECLTWSEVRELHNAGMEFGSHTVNHPKLVGLDWPDVRKELNESKSEIEQQIQAAVPAFAYPYAFPQADRDFADGFRQLMAEAGYRSCVTTEIGRAQTGCDPFQLCRLPANSDDDNRLLQAKLEGHYDWLALPQGVIKQAKHLAKRQDPRAPLPLHPEVPTADL